MPTQNQILFKKEQDRIKRFIRNATKRGFAFESDIVPKMPKRVTAKAIQKIKNIKPDTLYKTASYIDPQTGEYLSGTAGRKLERSRASIKGLQRKKAVKWETKIIDNYRQLLSNYDNTNFRPENRQIKQDIMDRLLDYFDMEVQNAGERVVATRIQANIDDVDEIAGKLVWEYRPEAVSFEATQFLSIIRGSPLSYEESAEFSTYGVY